MTASKKKSLVPVTRRLVAFLRELALSKHKLIRDIGRYESVMFIADLPPSLSGRVNSNAGPEDTLFSIPALKSAPPPTAPNSIESYIRLESIGDSSAGEPPVLASVPSDVRQSTVMQRWCADWIEWAHADRQLEPYRDWYRKLARAQRLTELQDDEFELILGIGLLSVISNGHTIRHPLITVPLQVSIDPANGQIDVVISSSARPRLTDRRLLEGMDFYDAKRLSSWRNEVATWEPLPLSIEAAQILQDWLTIGLERSYKLDESWRPPEHVSSALSLSWAPCIILRARDRSNLVEYYETMISSLDAEDAVAPLGLAQLVASIEANERVQWLEEDGNLSAAVLGQTPLFPLPSNPEQKAIIQTLRADSGVVVQGPPGTGKTHTIANLVSALLAQGQRVLVTSQKAQALRVLRDKMPEDIQNLCVSMTDVARGGSKELNASVTALSDRFNRFSAPVHESNVESLTARRDVLQRQISELKEAIRASRESETYQHASVADGYSGTLAQIAEKVREEQPRLDWFPLPLPSTSPGTCPLAVKQLLELHALLLTETQPRRARAHQDLPDIKELPSPVTIESLTQREEAATTATQRTEDRWFSSLASRTTDQRSGLRALLTQANLLISQLNNLGSLPWVERALEDSFRLANTHLWSQLATDLNVMTDAQDQLATLGLTPVSCPTLSSSGEGGLSARISDLKQLRQYLNDGGSFKKGPFRNSAQKKAEAFLNQCQVDGLPIRDLASLDQLLIFLHVEDVARKVGERLKDVGIEVDDSARLVPRVGQLSAIHRDLVTISALSGVLLDISGQLNLAGLTIRPLTPTDILEILDALDICELVDQLDSIKHEIASLRHAIDVMSSQPKAAPELRTLARAVESRDSHSYNTAFEALAKSFVEQAQQKRCNELLELLAASNPSLANHFRKSIEDPAWIARIELMPEAWAWAVALRFLEQQSDRHEADLQDKLRALLEDLSNTTAKLAAELAWGKCLKQMTSDQEKALRAYQSNISNKGKGAGKWASRYAKAAREAMLHARESVPAWIMPLNEVIDTIPPDQNSFDVVIIDEASQAGIEALFLLWLAPRIIVVGDERQCAPAGVVRGGLQPIFDRLDDYLPDIPDYLRLEFTPKSNLFSLLATRFGSVVRLREHFRCMPEIIGWSSAQFYSDAPLIPLRQFGADRLAPLQTTYIKGAYTDGSSSTLTNLAEAEAIVRQIQQCIANPEYANKTFGVIALQSAGQVRLLDDLLDAAIPGDERERRRLRVGTPPDFQGDERSVIFLSMVVAGSEKITAMTQREWQRRFNVAATRAEDQIWLFHSVTVDNLKTTDLRRSLLTYVMNPPQVFGGEQYLDLRWDSERRPPFGSKFEQRVFLKIRDRGYFVSPQFEVNGRFIDLVVSGAKGRLAVECDGDYWHSSRDDQMADLDRQIELERAGWRFVRIRESTFNQDPEKALQPLWTELERRGIRPNDLRPASTSEATDWNPLGLATEDGLDGIEELA